LMMIVDGVSLRVFVTRILTKTSGRTASIDVEKKSSRVSILLISSIRFNFASEGIIGDGNLWLRLATLSNKCAVVV
ncbi:MAG: hypothetical protein KDA47_21810, partial [Planctomycetales bacterium]|nr:hypothetical protein [Planctomycetales bacterium]